MEASFKAVVILGVDYKKGVKGVKHRYTDFLLDVSANLDEDSYIDKNNFPTKEGSNVFTNVLVQGLIANIHLAHQNEYRDSAEHLRYIISELERGFVKNVDISQSHLEM